MASKDAAPKATSTQRIVDAAERVFYRQGIHGVGVEAIAAEAGITKRTLYDRFGSKDAVIVAYLRQRHERWLARANRRLEDAAAPRIDALFESYLADVPDASRGCAFLNAAAELPRDHPAMDVVREHKAAVRLMVKRLVAEDAPHLDAETVEPQITLLLEGAIAAQGIDPDGPWMNTARSTAHALMYPRHETAPTASR